MVCGNLWELAISLYGANAVHECGDWDLGAVALVQDNSSSPTGTWWNENPWDPSSQRLWPMGAHWCFICLFHTDKYIFLTPL